MQKPRKSVDSFADDREALDFIASRIADEAQRNGISLSEIERKMLYFSETAWTLPDIWTASDEFDRAYDQNAYEKKISRLIREAFARTKKLKGEEFDGWIAAIRRLGKQDRYLLVMIKQAGLVPTFPPARPSVVRWRLWASSVVLVGLFAAVPWILERINPRPGSYRPLFGRYSSPFSESLSFSAWIILFCALIGAALLRFLLGAEKFNEVSLRCIKWIFDRPKRVK